MGTQTPFIRLLCVFLIVRAYPPGLWGYQEGHRNVGAHPTASRIWLNIEDGAEWSR